MTNQPAFQTFVREETPDSIAQHYSACMDSVNLINGPRRPGLSQELWNEVLRQNRDHLKVMLAREFWTTENLTPLQEAVDFVDTLST